MLAVAYRSASAQAVECNACALRTTLSTVIGGATSELSAHPTLVTATTKNRLLVFEEGRPPALFDSTGKFSAFVGRSGRGPGELTAPSWVDAEIDDSIRVLDVDRVVVLNPNGQAVRTVTGPSARFVWHGAFLSRTRYAAQTQIQDPRDPTRSMPIEVRSDSGKPLSSISVPSINGQKTFLAIARDLRGPQLMWLAEWTTRALRGYRIREVHENGDEKRTLSQSRAWWIEADFKADPVAALSKVQAIRQLDQQRLAVLIATPIRDWKRVTVDQRNMEGDRARYESVIEVIDVRTGVLLASARLKGYPLSLLSGSRAAVYLEADDGTPRIEIFRFELSK